MYSRDVSTDSDPNLFQSCKKRKILHEIFYIKIAKWTLTISAEMSFSQTSACFQNTGNGSKISVVCPAAHLLGIPH